MHIALISPAQGLRHILDLNYVRDTFLGSNASTCMPLVLPLLAALTPREHELTVLDEQTDDIDYDIPYDIVAITTITPCATRAYEIAAEFRKRGIYVVMGGLHISLFPEESQPHADTVCVGEAENIWPEFLNDFKEGHPKPLYRAEHVALDECIIPRWDVVPRRKYRFFSVQASRGCCYDCDFCTVRSMYGVTRYKPIDHLIKEVKTVSQQTMPWSDRFLLVDDNVFSNRAYAKELITALIPLKLHWECFAPLNIAEDEEMLELLKESGCDRLSVGLESISQESLASVHKGGVNKYSKYKDQIATFHEYGLPIVGLFILGFDGDDDSIFKRTRDFVQETAIAWPIYSILTPGPGTRLYDRMEEEKRMLHYRWRDFDGTHVVFQPKLMSAEDLYSGYCWIYKELYQCNAIFERTLALWKQNVLRHPKQQRATQVGVSAIILKELLVQPFKKPQLTPYLKRTLTELWAKQGIDIVNLLLNLGLAEYVDQLPTPKRSF